MVKNENDTGRAESGSSATKQNQSAVAQNAISIANEIEWFVKMVNLRLESHFPPSNKESMIENEKFVFRENSRSHQNEAPDLTDDFSFFAQFVKENRLTDEERIFLVLALLPHVQPQLLDVFFNANKSTGRGYTEIGGVKGTLHGGFLPTIETALFLIAGKDLQKRFEAESLFEPDHLFWTKGVLTSNQELNAGEPFHAQVLSLADEYVDLFTNGSIKKPKFSTLFPARLLQTKMKWEDLILDEQNKKQIQEIKIWLEHGNTLMDQWNMSARLKPGYKALFHGPPGTGKTLTAALLGKQFHLDVYRIDLSMVVSKYIGETEKNLEKVFSKAEHKNWILFFDEADALFGKRTNISDAHDKYANQEISYLLQRLEDFPGLVILASNMRNNVDEAFTRRLQSIIYFKKPQPIERFHIWKNSFSSVCQQPSDGELNQIAHQYEISGGSIMNVVQYASLLALSKNQKIICLEDIKEGIKREYQKEGKTL